MPKKVEESICWNCVNACGKCSWSSELKPVDKWKATKTKWSYMVKKCPMFEEDKRIRYGKITKLRLSQLIGCSERMIYLWDNKRIVNEAKKKGYNIYADITGKTTKFYIEE